MRRFPLLYLSACLLLGNAALASTDNIHHKKLHVKHGKVVKHVTHRKQVKHVKHGKPSKHLTHHNYHAKFAKPHLVHHFVIRNTHPKPLPKMHVALAPMVAPEADETGFTPVVLPPITPEADDSGAFSHPKVTRAVPFTSEAENEEFSRDYMYRHLKHPHPLAKVTPQHGQLASNTTSTKTTTTTVATDAPTDTPAAETKTTTTTEETVKHTHKKQEYKTPAVAATTTTTAVTTPPAEFVFKGYLDGSYNYLGKSNRFISGVHDRVYDIEPYGLTLQQVAITLSKQPAQGLGGLVNLIAGRDASTIAAYGYLPQSVGFDITQLYLQYGIRSFTLKGGKFVTIAGVEYVDSTLNNNFSRSILYGYAQPTTLMGLRGDYVVNNQLDLIAGINDGWDTIRDKSRRGTFELGAVYTPHPMVSFAITGYNGEERVAPAITKGPTGTRTLIDLVGTLNLTQKVTLVGDYDYAFQTAAALPNGTIGRAGWEGIAAYLNYKINDKFRTSLRGEYFDDVNGYRTGVVQTWKEATFTLAFTPLTSVEFRAETRYDFFNTLSVLDSDGKTGDNNQYSFALEGIYKF